MFRGVCGYAWSEDRFRRTSMAGHCLCRVGEVELVLVLPYTEDPIHWALTQSKNDVGYILILNRTTFPLCPLRAIGRLRSPRARPNHARRCPHLSIDLRDRAPVQTLLCAIT